MSFGPGKRNRQSIRLKGYDYTREGAYFVTVCAQDRLCLFGDVIDGEMLVNDAGRAIERWWLELNRKFPAAETDQYVVMPNHFHGVLAIGDTDTDRNGAHPDGEPQGAHAGAPLRSDVHADTTANVGTVLRVCPGGADTLAFVGADLCVCPDDPRTNQGAHTGAPLRSVVNGDARTGAPLPTFVQWFKTMTTNEYIRGVKTLGWQPFAKKLWQRNYYEHIIRDEESLAGIRQYIFDNPAQWAMDRENPNAAPATPGVAWCI